MDKKREAFTLIELVVAVAILAMVIVVSASTSGRWYLQNSVEAAKNMLVSSIQKSQDYAMTKKSDLTWGLCLIGRTIRVFGGSCATPSIKDDYVLPDSVVISGLSTVTFSDFRGEPSSALSITLTGNNKTFTVVVNMAGGLSVN